MGALYRWYTRSELMEIARKHHLPESTFLFQKSALELYSFLLEHEETFLASGMSAPDFLLTGLFHLCRTLYEAEAADDTVPDVECYLPKVVNYFLTLSEVDAEDTAGEAALLTLERELEEEFGFRRCGSFLWE